MFFAPGHWELIVVILVALLIFGTRLPTIARSVGKSIQSFRKGLKEVDIRDDIRQVTE